METEINTEIKQPTDNWLLQNIPKIIYFYWGAIKLPFLRYASILSFKKYNPDWKIVVIFPTVLSTILPWQQKQFESFCTEYVDYTDSLIKLSKKGEIKLEYFDFEEINISNSINEVHKSDLLRYYLLYSRGGVWSDMDVLYFKSINEISINTTNNSNKDIFLKYKVPSYTEIGVNGHAIGFLAGSKNNKFWEEVFNLAREKYSPEAYQVVGPRLLNDHYPVDNNLKLKYNLECISKSDIYCLDHDEDALFVNYDEKSHGHNITKNTIGIHWYGGHPQIKDVLLNINHLNYIDYNNNGFVIKMLKKQNY